MDLIRLLLLIGVSCLSYTYASNILGVFPMPAKSHRNVWNPLLLELAKKGHNLTVITGIEQDPPVRNYKDIVVQVNMFPKTDKNDSGEIRSKLRRSYLIEHLWRFGYTLCDQVLQNLQVQQLLKSKQQFDLIIIEAFSNECFFSFSHIFKSPFIQISAHSGTYWVTDAVGNPNPFAYIPDHLTDYGDHMTLAQRFHNALIGTAIRIGHNYWYIPKLDQIMRSHINVSDDDQIPPLSELEKKTSLILLNNHFSMGPPKPLVPNVIEIGGLHLKLPQKLPDDLQKFLDEAPNGAIYISFGTNIQSATLPVEKKDAILNAVSKLKQKVIWKWEEDTMDGKSENIILGKWFPQGDLLGHKNIRAFITHGGLSSTQEALFNGVPLIGIPMVADQKHNLAVAQSRGCALVLDYETLNEDTLYTALDTVLNNETYSNRSKEMARIFRDRPLSPLQEAVYWTEYVIRHKGAPHMRNGSLDLAWYQYLLLDVVIILLSTVAVSLLLVFFSVRTFIRLFTRKSNKRIKEHTNKKSTKKIQ